MNIRNAKSSDAKAILTITENSWLEQYANQETGLTPEDILGLHLTSDDAVNHQAKLLDTPSPRRYIVVAEDNSEVIGYILLVKREKIGWYLKSIYVQKGFRSIGVGSKLMKAASEHLRSTAPDSKRVTLDVVKTNSRAIKFYNQLGWSKTGKDTFLIAGKTLPTIQLTYSLKA